MATFTALPQGEGKVSKRFGAPVTYRGAESTYFGERPRRKWTRVSLVSGLAFELERINTISSAGENMRPR